jgi:N-acetylneuraminic acid mutarotase
MKTNNKISAYIVRGSMGALLFSCVIVALCSAVHLPEQPPKALPPQDNAGFGANGTLSFADRVAYQRAIENVFWRHRIWPKERPDPKPSLDAVMSQAQLEKKVTEYLRNSQALEDDWQRPITVEQLQAEMERMASNTKQPEVLRELFEALGNDPFVIAECLARPVLTERLIADLSGQDKTGRFESLRNAETQMPREVAIDLTPKAFGVQVNRPYHLPVIGSPSGSCIDDTWTPTSTNNAPDGRIHHTAVWTGTEMIVWGGYDGNDVNTGGRYDPSTDSWTATSTTNAPSERELHTAVWTGSEMIVWGGYCCGCCGGPLNTGGRYNPITDSWTATSTTNAAGARFNHTAVWSGSEMIVWGGLGPGSDGGRYNPSTDSWTATNLFNAPEARHAHTAVWTGSEMIVWGGWDNAGGLFNTGGRYNPITDSWTATSTINAPSARRWHTAVWSDSESEMIVWGGGNFNSDFNTGGRYHPLTDIWTETCTTNAPSPRNSHTAVLIGNEMIVWGGNPGPLNTGGRYNHGINCWTATSTTNAPSARAGHRAVSTGTEMIVWGGGNDLNTGGRYCASGAGPTPTPTSSPTPTATATATATPTATATATPSATPRVTPRPRPTPHPRP